MLGFKIHIIFVVFTIHCLTAQAGKRIVQIPLVLVKMEINVQMTYTETTLNTQDTIDEHLTSLDLKLIRNYTIQHVLYWHISQ